jgi:hypothetical protein
MGPLIEEPPRTALRRPTLPESCQYRISTIVPLCSPCVLRADRPLPVHEEEPVNPAVVQMLRVGGTRPLTSVVPIRFFFTDATNIQSDKCGCVSRVAVRRLARITTLKRLRTVRSTRSPSLSRERNTYQPAPPCGRRASMFLPSDRRTARAPGSLAPTKRLENLAHATTGQAFYASG